MAKKEIDFFGKGEVKEIAKTVGKGLVVVGSVVVAGVALGAGLHAFKHAQGE